MLRVKHERFLNSSSKDKKIDQSSGIFLMMQVPIIFDCKIIRHKTKLLLLAVMDFLVRLAEKIDIPSLNSHFPDQKNKLSQGTGRFRPEIFCRIWGKMEDPLTMFMRRPI